MPKTNQKEKTNNFESIRVIRWHWEENKSLNSLPSPIAEQTQFHTSVFIKLFLPLYFYIFIYFPPISKYIAVN